jgi:hypothetical protein
MVSGGQIGHYGNASYQVSCFKTNGQHYTLPESQMNSAMLATFSPTGLYSTELVWDYFYSNTCNSKGFSFGSYYQHYRNPNLIEYKCFTSPFTVLMNWN